MCVNKLFETGMFMYGTIVMSHYFSAVSTVMDASSFAGGSPDCVIRNIFGDVSI